MRPLGRSGPPRTPARELDAAEQERFSRHLLLDGFGGAGQQRLRAGAVALELPAGFDAVARSCARALAAAGVGELLLRGPWAAAAEQECARLSPGCARLADEGELAARSSGRAGEGERGAGGDRGEPGDRGERGLVFIRHEAAGIALPIGERIEERGAHQPDAPAPPVSLLLLPARPPGSPAEAAALGALAALEAMKLLGRAGRPAPLPLAVFPPAPERTPR